MASHLQFVAFLCALPLALCTFSYQNPLENSGLPALPSISKPFSGFNTRQNRAYSWSPNMPVVINTYDRNVVIPRTLAGNLDTAQPANVPVYRSEASPNQRFIDGPDGGISRQMKRRRNGEEKTVWVNIGGDPTRTQDFMQQSRYANRHSSSSPNLFDANDQTIRYGSIPLKTAQRIISSSVSEGMNTVSDQQRLLGQTPDVKNTDINKAHNQFGVRGKSLEELRAGMGSNIGKGTTFFGRRNSEPMIRTGSGTNGMFSMAGRTGAGRQARAPNRAPGGG